MAHCLSTTHSEHNLLLLHHDSVSLNPNLHHFYSQAYPFRAKINSLNCLRRQERHRAHLLRLRELDRLVVQSRAILSLTLPCHSRKQLTLTMADPENFEDDLFADLLVLQPWF